MFGDTIHCVQHLIVILSSFVICSVVEIALANADIVITESDGEAEVCLVIVSGVHQIDVVVLLQTTAGSATGTH